MTLGYQFSDWINAVAGLLEYDNTIINAAAASPSSSAAFNTFYPRAIEYAEQRIYREIDLLNTRVTDSAAATPNSRVFTLPTAKGAYVVLEQVAAFVAGVRQAPLLAVSKEALEALYPSDAAPTVPSVPTLWAPVNQTTILVAPPPDTGLTLECFGTQRPAPLSAANPTSFLTVNLPDLFLAGSMIAWSGFQRDFGAQSDDPKMAQSWEAQYGNLMKSAAVEELRKKWQSAGWSSRLPSAVATPPQT